MQRRVACAEVCHVYRVCHVCTGVSRVQRCATLRNSDCVTVEANKRYVMSVATVTLMYGGWQSADR